MLQQTLAYGPAFVHFANEIFLARDRVVEERLAERRCTADQLDRLNGDARLMHRQKHEADAVVLRHVGIGANEREHPVGVLRTRRPDLLAVDQEVIAAIFRACAQAGEIRTRARLAVTLTPAHFAANDRRNVAALLIFGAEFEQRRADHRRAHAHQRRARFDAAHLLDEHDVLFFVNPPPPYAFGHIGAVQPFSAIRVSHVRVSGSSILIFVLPVGICPGPRAPGGQFCASHARVSARNSSIAAICMLPPMKHRRIGERSTKLKTTV